MDFGFTVEQETFRRRVREFALKELLPGYTERDRERRCPLELRVRIRQLIGRPRDVDFIRSGIAVEELGRGDLNCAFWGESAAGVSPLYSGEQSTLGKYISGDDDQVGLALTEPNAGADLGAISTAARRDGDEWVLDGEKNSVSYLNAPVFIVFARIAGAERGWRGVSAFAVPRTAEGLDFETFEDLGTRSIPRGILRLRGVRVPAEDQLWKGPGAGESRGSGSFRHMVQFFNTNKAYVGLMCIGATQQTLDEIVEYAKTRETYGRPIARYQGVAFPIAEAATYLEMARLLCYKVLWLRQQEADHQVEGAMVKWFIPHKCVEILNECMVLRGHLGYTESLPIAQRLRDVAGWQIGDGPPQIQKILISRSIFGRDYEPR